MEGAGVTPRPPRGPHPKWTLKEEVWGEGLMITLAWGTQDQGHCHGPLGLP